LTSGLPERRYTKGVEEESSIHLFIIPSQLLSDLMPVKMQLARIIISELTENQVIYLREVDGSREFPILIGIFEATNIDRRVKEDYEPLRPLTHDLVVSVAEALGAAVDSVIISELNHSTYYAQLRLRTEDGEIIEIDSRPSDAIAVAVTFSPPLPIYVSEHVLDEATSAI
jgi:bifunctional DNase/RNase